MSDQSSQRATSSVEVDRFRDAEWALRDLDVQRQFEGWVVAYQRGLSRMVTTQARGAIRYSLVETRATALFFCAREDRTA